MPQLMQPLANERGSVLVAAFAFAIVMAIAGSGLLMLSGHGANLEDEQWQQELAFQGAESGVELGKRWLSVPAVYDNLDENKPHTDLTINNMQVRVTISIDTVFSQVNGAGLDENIQQKCPVKKDGSAWPGILVNSYITSDLSNIYFDGPAHFNHHITIGPERNVHFYNYPVSIHTASYTQYGYGNGPSGNNYDYGINVEGLSINGTQGDTLDQFFSNTFTHSQDLHYFIPPSGTPFNLPSNTISQRATLYFYVSDATNLGMARYYYNNQSDSFTVDGRYIYASNSLNVLGTVKGQVTVETAPNCHIYPVGDLCYAGTNFDQITYDNPLPPGMSDYNNSQDYGLSGLTHFLALVSGGNIHFKDGYQQTIEPEDFNNGTLSNNYGQRRRLFCTASLIATNQDCGISWDLDGENIDLNDYQYNLYVVGTRAVDRFFNYSTRSINGDADTTFNFYYDTRLRDPGITAPGIPGFKRVTTAGNELFLLSSRWRQRNIPVE